LLKTGIACYEKEAYTVDEDEFLDVDFDREEEISRELNEGVDFWCDEE
jgi:hypothetical protein